MKGYDLSEREKKYIDENPQKFASVLSKDLGTMFPEDNGGNRGKSCINKYLGSDEHHRRVLAMRNTSSRVKSHILI